MQVAGQVRDRKVAAGRSGARSAPIRPRGSSASLKKCRMPNSMTATGRREVERLGRLPQDRLRVVQVPVDVAGRALRVAPQQLVGVGQHDRVLVDVHDPGVGRVPLRHLVHVVFLGDAGADVEELGDPGVAREVPHHAAERRPVRAHVGPNAVDPARQGRVDALGGLPVDLEVGPAAEQVVIDARRVGHGGVDLGGFSGPCGGPVAGQSAFLPASVRTVRDQQTSLIIWPFERLATAEALRPGAWPASPRIGARVAASPVPEAANRVHEEPHPSILNVQGFGLSEKNRRSRLMDD